MAKPREKLTDKAVAEWFSGLQFARQLAVLGSLQEINRLWLLGFPARLCGGLGARLGWRRLHRLARESQEQDGHHHSHDASNLPCAPLGGYPSPWLRGAFGDHPDGSSKKSLPRRPRENVSGEINSPQVAPNLT